MKQHPSNHCAMRRCGVALAMLLAVGPVAAQPRTRPEQDAQAQVVEEPYAATLRIRALGEVVLGEVDAVELELSGAGVGGGTPEFVSTIGKLGNPSRIGAGRYRVRLTLPSEKFPQWALVAAFDGKRYGWLALPLLARAQVQVESEPGVNVKVRVQGSVFGPIVTDARGRGQVQVLVPPGVTAAESIGIDALGNTNYRPIQLGVPPSKRILLYCPAGAEHAFVFRTEMDGAASVRPALRVQSSEVTVEPPKSLAPGVYRVSFSVPEGMPAGTSIKLRASAGAAGTDECETRIPFEEPNALSLSADESQLNADGTVAVLLQLDWRFRGRRTPKRPKPEIAVSLGKVAEVVQVSETRQVVKWSLPRHFSGQAAAVAQIRYAGESPLTAAHRVRLEPGVLKHLSLTLPKEPLLADGKTQARVLVRGLDAHSNPVPLNGIFARATGKVGTPEPLPGGGLQLDYTTPGGDALSADQLVVRETQTGIEAQAELALTPLRSRLWLGGRAGYMHNFGQLGQAIVMVGAGARVPLWTEGFVVGIEAGYYQGTLETNAAVEGPDGFQGANGERVNLRVSGVPLAGRVAYQLQVGPLIVYPGVSGGVVLSDTSAHSASSGRVASSSVLPLVAGLGGAQLPLGGGSAALEVSYWALQLDETFVTGNPGGLQLTLGYAASL